MPAAAPFQGSVVSGTLFFARLLFPAQEPEPRRPW